MTRDEWETCSDPEAMLAWLREQGTLSDRKARLFAVSCCRRLWPLLKDRGVREAVVVAEQLADRAATTPALQRAYLAQFEASVFSYAGNPLDVALYALHGNAQRASQLALSHAGDPETERSTHCRLLRDIVEPFHTPFNPALRIPAAIALATAIYDDKAFDRLPILADALEEAGCTDAELLGHLRSPGPHARGCWVVDLLLGKE